MKIGIIVQARMGSQRLPEKVLQPIAGKPMLQYVLERLERGCPELPLVVATSDDDQDTRIASFCAEHGFSCVRGSLHNVAARFVQVSQLHSFDAFVRISGDSPLLDHNLVHRAVELFVNRTCDLVTNIMPRTFPRGQSVEVIKTSSLTKALDRMTDDEDFEHVTKFYYKNPKDFQISNFEFDGNRCGIHLAVDRPEDMSAVKAVIEKMIRPHWDYHLDEIIDLYLETNTESSPTSHAA